MDLFARFTQQLKKSMSALKKKNPPSVALLKAVESADNWETLEKHLVELRTLSRKRQQEVLERLEPLAKRIEALIAQAKETNIKVVKQNLLRQAEGFMQELEAEDEPARIHGANCQMLTNIIKQAQRARAMAERGVEANVVDAIATHLDDIVVGYEEAMEAARELEQAGTVSQPAEPDAKVLAKRLSAVYETGAEEEKESGVAESAEGAVSQLEKKLYEA